MDAFGPPRPGINGASSCLGASLRLQLLLLPLPLPNRCSVRLLPLRLH
jgi:hypothetical protein